MTGVQLFRLALFLFLPVTCGALGIVAQRTKVTVGDWKGGMLLYAPLIGATLSLAVFAAVIVISVRGGH